MASTIKLKNGSGAPLATDLVTAEPALDLTNKRLYTEDSGGTVIEVGTNPTEIQIDNINIDGNTISSTDTDGNIAITPDGTGEVDISKVDIDSGTIDGTVIGGTTTAAGSFTTLQADTSLNVDGTVTADGLTVAVGDEIDFAGGLGEYASSPALGIVGFTSRGSVEMFTDSNNNGASTGTAFAIYDGAEYGGSTKNLLTVTKGNDISFYEDTGATAKFFWDAAAESLGINTTTPSSALDIIGDLEVTSSTNTAAATFTSATDNTGVVITNTATGGGTWKLLSTGGTSGYGQGSLAFEKDSSLKMVLDSSGNVGIGTTSPSANLHVKGATGITVQDDSGSLAQIQFLNSTGTNIFTAKTGADDMFFDNTSGDTVFRYSGTTEAMRITSGGDVGIGVTPGAWGSTFKVLQVARASLFSNISAGDYGIYANSFSDGTNDIYIGSTGAGKYKFNTTSRQHQWFTAPSGTAGNAITFDQAMTLDASGNLLVGKTSIGTANVGTEARANGLIQATRDGGNPLELNRKGSGGTENGTIIDLRSNGLTVGSIGVNSLRASFVGESSRGLAFAATGPFPCSDSAGTKLDTVLDLGVSNARFDDIYATNGTIQTSDRNEKQDIEELSEAEQRVAVAAKGLLRKFRWQSSVAEKDDDARIHFGIIAQDLQAAFEAEGLDAGRYAMFIHSTWTDEETGEERSRMGVRYSELLAFIIAAI